MEADELSLLEPEEVTDAVELTELETEALVEADPEAEPEAIGVSLELPEEDAVGVRVPESV